MKKQRILLKNQLRPQLDAALAARYDLHGLHKESSPEAFLQRHGAEFVGLATSARFGANRGLIEALPNLKVISCLGVGVDNIDVAYARERGIQVGYTPDILSDCVADTAFGLLIDAARGFSRADRFVRRGDWLKGRFPFATSVARKKLGILGMGRIGSIVAKRATGFDMEVRYHNRRQVHDSKLAYEPTLLGLASWADFLVIAASGNPDTKRIVTSDVLAALGSNGFLINVARGSIVDEAALIEALRSGRIAGAGLDVFDNEPNVAAGLLDLENVVLLPHIAANTHETQGAMAELVIENLESFFSTGTVKVAAS